MCVFSVHCVLCSLYIEWCVLSTLSDVFSVHALSGCSLHIERCSLSTLSNVFSLHWVCVLLSTLSDVFFVDWVCVLWTLSVQRTHTQSTTESFTYSCLYSAQGTLDQVTLDQQMWDNAVVYCWAYTCSFRLVCLTPLSVCSLHVCVLCTLCVVFSLHWVMCSLYIEWCILCTCIEWLFSPHWEVFSLYIEWCFLYIECVFFSLHWVMCSL